MAPLRFAGAIVTAIPRLALNCSSFFRAIAFSFCDMTLNNFQNLMNSMSGEIDDENEIAALEQDQTLLGVIGLKDPIRPGVKDVIAKAVRSRIALRLVSGDHLETTAAVARDVGILSAEEE